LTKKNKTLKRYYTSDDCQDKLFLTLHFYKSSFIT